MRTLESILNDLQTLEVRFQAHEREWKYLKSHHEFQFDAGMNFKIAKLYEEGCSCAHYLAGGLNTNDLKNSSVLLDEYISQVISATPEEGYYKNIRKHAEDEANSKYPTNYTVKYMLRQYEQQWADIQRAQQFINELKGLSNYQPLRMLDPMQVIRTRVKHWEQNAQLHVNASETNLRSHLVSELREKGFNATAETHAFLGHCDIVISHPQGSEEIGNLLVSECKFWDGPMVLFDAISQVCGYTTPNDIHASVIMFVRTDFKDACDKALQTLITHPCYGGNAKGKDYIEFLLKPAQNPDLKIQASLLLCNLTIKKYTRAEIIPSPVRQFNKYLEDAFGEGECRCSRCKESGGDETGYSFKHTFEFSGDPVNRRFSITTADTVLSALKKSWLSFYKKEMITLGDFPLDFIEKFVDSELQDRLRPLFLASGLAIEKDEKLIFNYHSNY